MKISIILILSLLCFNLNLNGQTRTIFGRVITEDLEPIPMLVIENSFNVPLGETDMEGRFKINIPVETDSLLFDYLGMERSEIKLMKDCNKVEIVMMNYGISHNRSSRKIDKLRKKRFDDLPNLHSNAVENGLFENNNICYERFFESFKPTLDSISKILKKKRKVTFQ